MMRRMEPTVTIGPPDIDTPWLPIWIWSVWGRVVVAWGGAIVAWGVAVVALGGAGLGLQRSVLQEHWECIVEVSHPIFALSLFSAQPCLVRLTMLVIVSHQMNLKQRGLLPGHVSISVGVKVLHSSILSHLPW